MKNVGRWLLVVLCVAAVAAPTAWLVLQEPEWRASPDELRPFGVTLVDEPLAFGAAYPNEVHIQRADRDGRVVMPEGSWIELVAYSLFVPEGAHAGPVDLVYRDPRTLEVFDVMQMDSIAMPQPWRVAESADVFGGPQLRAIFKLSSPAPPELSKLDFAPDVKVWVWDERTGANVSRVETRGRHGDLFVFDIQLMIWHDTSLQFGLLKGPFGPPWAFEIAGLPDMPNGSDVANLFDARIPYLAMGTDGSELAESVQAADIAARAVELRTLDLRSEPGSFYRERKVIYDTTPRELLNRHLAGPDPVRIQVDSAAGEIRFEYPKPWREQLMEWWIHRSPDWLH